VGVALGPRVGELLGEAVDTRPDGLAEQLDRMRAPAATSATRAAILNRIMSASYWLVAVTNQ
jgi:hypothetical protein